MAARIIVLTAAFVAWLPASLIFFIGGNPLGLVLPVMGFCPLPSRSGEIGYSETGMLVWGIGLLMFFVILGCVAVVRKSLPLALAFSGLLGLSVILVLVRFMADLNGIH